MKTQSVKLSSATHSKWLFVDSRKYTDLNLSYEVNTDAGVNLTGSPPGGSPGTLNYDVQYTLDENANSRIGNVVLTASGSPVGSEVTVSHTAHGLSTGDNVIILESGYTNHNSQSGVEGSYDVTVVDVNTYTYTPSSAMTGSTLKARVITFTVNSIATGVSASSNGNLSYPINAIRLNVNVITGGSLELKVLQQG